MRRRQGFTIPELLVAMALIMFIMAILAEAFKAGLDSYRRLKAVGDLQEKLRSVTSTLRADLASKHFGDARTPSDPSIWTVPEASGFFAVYGTTSASPTIPSPIPPGFGDVPSVEMPAWPAVPSLYFTVRNLGTDRQSFFTSRIPDATYAPPLNYLASQGPADYWDVTRDTYHNNWTEVAYFVRPNGTTAGGTTLFGLYRRQLTLVADSPPQATYLNTAPNQIPYSPLNQALFASVSCKANLTSSPPPPGSFLQFNGPLELGNNATNTVGTAFGNPNITTNMMNRALWQTPTGAGWQFPPDYPTMLGNQRFETLRPAQDLLPGDDLILNDVIEFNVRLLITLPATPGGAPYDFIDVPATPLTVTAGPGGPVFGAPLPAFDTAAMLQPQYQYGTPSAQPYLPRALQIILRVWDLKTQTTRQVTLVQAL